MAKEEYEQVVNGLSATADECAVYAAYGRLHEERKFSHPKPALGPDRVRAIRLLSEADCDDIWWFPPVEDRCLRCRGRASGAGLTTEMLI